MAKTKNIKSRRPKEITDQLRLEAEICSPNKQVMTRKRRYLTKQSQQHRNL